MHELALCEAIVGNVRKHVGDRPLRQVNVRIGHLRQVVPDSLVFAWELLTEGTDLAGCELVVDHVPAAITCRGCHSTSELDSPLMVCPACGGHDVAVISGEELQIASVDVAEGVT